MTTATSTTHETRAVQVGEVSVTYHDSVDPVSDRPTVVLIHGTGGSTAAHFPYLFPMLAVDQRVVSIDLAEPGHDGPLELGDLVAQVVAVLESVDVESVTLVGYSLGAVVALAVAGRHTDLVGRLVTVAGWMLTDPQQRLRNDVWKSLWKNDEDAARKFAVYTALSPQFLELMPEPALDGVVAMMNNSEFQTKQMELNRRIDIRDDVDNIVADTLVIGCGSDYTVPPSHSKALFGAISNARYTEIESGHGVIAERPAELVRWIGIFNQDPGRFPIGQIAPSVAP